MRCEVEPDNEVYDSDHAKAAAGAAPTYYAANLHDPRTSSVYGPKDDPTVKVYVEEEGMPKTFYDKHKIKCCPMPVYSLRMSFFLSLFFSI